MPPCCRQVKIDMRVIFGPPEVHAAFRATAKWRWTCSHVADAAPEWLALLAATTTATLILRADPSCAHAEKNSETACRRVTDESVRVPPSVPYRSHTYP